MLPARGGPACVSSVLGVFDVIANQSFHRWFHRTAPNLPERDRTTQPVDPPKTGLDLPTSALTSSAVTTINELRIRKAGGSSPSERAEALRAVIKTGPLPGAALQPSSTG